MTDYETCGAWGGCPLPAGHNRGKPDLPENHDRPRVALAEAMSRARVSQVIANSSDTFEQFARRVGISVPDLESALLGRRQFTAAEMARIARAGNVPLAWLAAVDEASPAPPLPSLLGRIRCTLGQPATRGDAIWLTTTATASFAVRPGVGLALTQAGLTLGYALTSCRRPRR